MAGWQWPWGEGGGRGALHLVDCGVGGEEVVVPPPLHVPHVHPPAPRQGHLGGMVCRGVPWCANMCWVVPSCASVCCGVPRFAVVCNGVLWCAVLPWCAVCGVCNVMPWCAVRQSPPRGRSSGPRSAPPCRRSPGRRWPSRPAPGGPGGRRPAWRGAPGAGGRRAGGTPCCRRGTRLWWTCGVVVVLQSNVMLWYYVEDVEECVVGRTPVDWFARPGVGGWSHYHPPTWPGDHRAWATTGPGTPQGLGHLRVQGGGEGWWLGGHIDNPYRPHVCTII